MNEVLQSEIERLVDSGYELTTVTPDGRAELAREGELVLLRLQRGYVTAERGLRVAPPTEPPMPPPVGGEVRRARPGRVAEFGGLREEEFKPLPLRQPRGGLITKIITALVLLGLVVGAFVFSRAAVEGPVSSESSPGAHSLQDVPASSGFILSG